MTLCVGPLMGQAAQSQEAATQNVQDADTVEPTAADSAATGSKADADAGPLRGAQAVMKAVADQAGKPAPKAEAEGEEVSLRDAIERYRQRRATMTSRRAGNRWLALFDKYVGSASRAAALGGMNGGGRGGGFAELVKALPGPKAWPTMAQALAQRDTPKASGPAMREAGLGLFIHFLVSDTDAMETDLQALLDRTKNLQPWRRQNLAQNLQQLAGVIGQREQDPKAVIEAVEARIRAVRLGGEVYGFDVPDLVTRVGEDKAKKLLARIVVLPVQHLQFEAGDRTKALARKVTLEHVDQLPRPRWGLVDNLDAVDLFEAMRDRFLAPPKTDKTDKSDGKGEGDDHGDDTGDTDDAQSPAPAPSQAQGGSGFSAVARLFGFASPNTGSSVPMNDYELASARVYYALGLIARGRTDEAVREFHILTAAGQGPGPGGAGVSLPYDAMGQLDRAGYTAQVYRVVDKLLAEDPTLPLWQLYASLAVRTGHPQAMLDRAEQAAEAKDLTKPRRRVIRHNLLVARLAAQTDDKAIAQAVGTLKQLIATAPAPGVTFHYPQQSRLDLALKLATLGDLTGHEAWYDQGISLVQSQLESPQAASMDQWGVERAANEATALMIRRGEYRRAEKLLQQALTLALRARAKQARDRGAMAWSASMNRDTPDALLGLAGLYHAAGRDREVLTLLREAPYWGQGDLADLVTEPVSEGRTLGSVTAWALIAQGHKDKALKIAHALIDQKPGDDRGYELLVHLQGIEALPYLDQAYARDPFEERPLIWKARLQLTAGRDDPAEATIRRAIAIDPSDGEEGRGDRMRAYGVLADVLRAEGKAKRAAFFDGVVKSIRKSEEADRFHAAGMTARAVAMYHDALNDFADAYCIQSRLAIQLASLGRMDQAAEHYRRAYELMPSSFGRVESHCFGCEGVFRSPIAQSIAEDVFLGLVKSKPKNPQVRYLLGYLREAQQRYAPATRDYRQAVKLDPDYLNAWSHLAAMADHIHMPVKQRDRAILSVLRLDPLQRHASADLREVFDAKALWRTVASAHEAKLTPPDHLLTLVAAKRRIEKREKALSKAGASQNALDAMRQRTLWRRRDGVGPPGEVLAQHKVVQALGPVMQSNSGF